MTASTTICAGCASSSGPFTCVYNGIAVLLCSTCADRLLGGESKSTIIKTIQKREAA